METKTKKRLHWGLAAALLLPLALIGLFEWLKGSRAVMDFWVFEVLKKQSGNVQICNPAIYI